MTIFNFWFIKIKDLSSLSLVGGRSMVPRPKLSDPKKGGGDKKLPLPKENGEGKERVRPTLDRKRLMEALVVPGELRPH